MDATQDTRLTALDGVIGAFLVADPTVPSPAEAIALAEWVISGDTTTALCLEQLTRTMYGHHTTPETTDTTEGT